MSLIVLFVLGIGLNSVQAIPDGYTMTFTEVGTIAPYKQVMNARFIEYGGTLNNTLAFIVDMNRGAVVLYNVTDATNIIELDHYSLPFIHDIELDEDRKLLYVTASNGTNILSYNNPTTIQYISAYSNYTTSTYIHVLGEVLYIGAEGEGLHIVNMTDRYNPTFITNWVDNEGDVGPVYVIDDYTYACTGTGEGVYVEKFGFLGIRTPNIGGTLTPIGLRILNLTDLTNVTLLGTPMIGDDYNADAPTAHDISHNLAFIPDFNSGLKILGYGFPLSLMPSAGFKDEVGSIVNDVAFTDDGIVFLAIDQGGLQVIDVSNIENLEMVGSYSHTWQTLRIAVKNDVIYLATLGGGIRILTWELVEDESIPIHLGFIVGSTLTGILILSIRVWQQKKTH